MDDGISNINNSKKKLMTKSLFNTFQMPSAVTRLA